MITMLNLTQQSLNTFLEFLPRRKKEKKKGGTKKKKKKIEPVRLIDGKRSYNIEIALKTMKMKTSEFRSAVLSMNGEILTEDKVMKLLNMVPNEEEVKKLTKYKKDGKDASHLATVEGFMYQLFDIPDLENRLKLWIFKMGFHEGLQDQKDCVDQLLAAEKVIRFNPSFHDICDILLYVGNYLNFGNRKGDAFAFAFESFLQFSGTRSNDGKYNLLMYCIRHLMETEPDCINISVHMRPIRDCIKVEKETFEDALRHIEDSLENVKKKVDKAKKGKQIDGDKFLPIMGEFYSKAMTECDRMKKKYDTFSKQCKELATSYGLKKMNWEDFFNLWRSFLEEWDKNVDKTKKLIKAEMKEKRAKEKKKLKKKPRLGKKSERREPKGRKVNISKRKKRRKAKGKRHVAVQHEEPDSEEEKELAELVQLQAEHPEVLDAKLEKVFRTMDQDNSGLLDLKEFKVAARKFDLNEEEDIKICFNRVDTDGDGTLDFGEFRMAIKIALTDKHLMAGINRKMRKTLRSGGLLNLHYEDVSLESVTVQVDQEA